MWGTLATGLLAVVLLLPAGPRTPYETCVRAANTPGPTGFAVEVCEPLMEER